MHRISAHRLAAPALAVFVALGAAACGNRGGENANNANNAGGNANRAAANAGANTSANANYGSANSANAGTAGAPSDTALKNSVEANLTKAGVSGVSVEVAEGVVTLKGNVQRAKLQDAVKAANDAGPRRVLNQLNAQ